MLNWVKNLFVKPSMLRRVDQIQDDVYIPKHFHIDRQAHIKKEK